MHEKNKRYKYDVNKYIFIFPPSVALNLKYKKDVQLSASVARPLYIEFEILIVVRYHLRKPLSMKRLVAAVRAATQVMINVVCITIFSFPTLGSRLTAVTYSSFL